MKGITHRSTLLGKYSHDTMWSVYAVILQLSPAAKHREVLNLNTRVAKHREVLNLNTRVAEHREVLNLNTRVAALVSGYTYMCVCVML